MSELLSLAQCVKLVVERLLPQKLVVVAVPMPSDVVLVVQAIEEHLERLNSQRLPLDRVLYRTSMFRGVSSSIGDVVVAPTWMLDYLICDCPIRLIKLELKTVGALKSADCPDSTVSTTPSPDAETTLQAKGNVRGIGPSYSQVAARRCEADRVC